MIQTFPAPRTPRELFALFALLDAEKGLPSLLSRLDFADVPRRQLVAAATGERPTTPKAAIDGDSFNARAALAALLNGADFQAKIRETILNAWPEKRRAIFIHIPKCAGTDLIAGLRRRYPMLHNHLAIPEITGKPELFAHLRDLAIAIPLLDTIAAAGHVPLRWYLERDLVRYNDLLFTTVRDPGDMIYSYIAFILTRLVTFQGVKRNDTSNWLGHIGLTEIEPDPSPAYLIGLGSKLLRSAAVTGRNMICNNLGRGTEASALETMVVTDIEITDMKRYSAWRSRKFGFQPEKRINESKPLYNRDSAPAEDRAYIEEMIEEDRKLYARIVQALDRTDALSVTGAAFA